MSRRRVDRDTGWHPILRALVGIVLGAAAGALAAALVPRERVPHAETGPPAM